MGAFTDIRPLLVICSLLASGCTTVPPDLGRSDVDALVSAAGRVTDYDSPSLLATLDSTPLTSDLAVRVAITNNPRLRASYARLGIAAADVYLAGRIRNPIFSTAILNPSQGGDLNRLSFGIIGSFIDLVTLPARKRLGTMEFASFKKSLGAEVLAIASDTEKSYYEYVAAKQSAFLQEQIANTANLTLELAQRFFAAGNLTPRALARHQAAASQAYISHLKAAAAVDTMRTDLANIMGLSVADDWEVSPSLPLPTDNDHELSELIALANTSRLDLAAAKISLEVTADAAGMTGWARWLTGLSFGLEHERETDGEKLTGPTVSWQLPIFSQNRDAVLVAAAQAEIALAEYLGLRQQVTNEVQLAFRLISNAKKTMQEYRRRLIPARTDATKFAQAEQNFMLLGIFEVIESKNTEYEAYQKYIESVRDYWLAKTALVRAVGNSLPNSGQDSSEYLDIRSNFAPPTKGLHTLHQSAKPKLDDGHSTMHSETSQLNSQAAGEEKHDHQSGDNP